MNEWLRGLLTARRRAHQTVIVHPSRLEAMQAAVEAGGMTRLLAVRASELVEEDKALVFPTSQLTSDANP